MAGGRGRPTVAGAGERRVGEARGWGELDVEKWFLDSGWQVLYAINVGKKRGYGGWKMGTGAYVEQ
jgi:hypothetical protein